jgi:tRNA threonylcarbamoyladenosine modification (KEOPS) complex Cgi121 subunit
VKLVKTPLERNVHCQCWEVDVETAEVEGLLASLRKETPKAIIQVFGASPAPNAEVVELIAAQTLAAAKSGSTLADRPELDLLLRLAGTRQIGDAFERAGYKSSGKRLYMVAASEGNGTALKRLMERASRDRRFAPLVKKALGKDDFEVVERAALLAARL